MAINLLSDDNLGWKILRPEEKEALMLQYGHSKSSWKAGEILNKAHYKYLEISDRAKEFFKTFTKHYELFGVLIPKRLDKYFEPGVKSFLIGVIEKRLKVSESVSLCGNNKMKVPIYRNRALIDSINRLQNSTNIEANKIAELIINFDRWNNFRVLPDEIQEPSAYKRRNKNRDKKAITIFVSIPNIVINLILAKLKKGKDWYVPIFKDKNLSIITIKNCSYNEAILSRLFAYAFDDEDNAYLYGNLILKNFFRGKTPKEGLGFWEEYRKLIQLSPNMLSVQKIHPNREALKFILEANDTMWI